MKIKKLLSILLLLCSVTQLTYGQADYYNQQPRFLKANSVWCFGDYAGLDFNNGGPVSFKSNAPWFTLGSINSTSSVADPMTGRLLFYTNGKQFFKSNGQLMTNGALSDTSWGTCIVPIVSQPGKYYVFSLNTPDSIPIFRGNTFWPTGLFYSIVDMSLDNGRGDVDPAYRSVLLDGDLPSASMVSVLGDRCDDIWLLVYFGSKNVLKAYHITPQGIDPNPVISNLPMQMEPSKMAISPDRKKMAIITRGAVQNFPLNRLYISNFNASTGQISNTIAVGVDSAGTYRNGRSVCFSPDNSKLYAQISTPSTGAIYQFEVSAYDSTSIAQSIKYITESSLVSGYLKLYNDTIYVAGGIPLLGSAYFLSRINQPNLSGAACQYDNRVISLATGSFMSAQPFHNEVVLPMGYDYMF
jgi:hypothetical protein